MIVTPTLFFFIKMQLTKATITLSHIISIILDIFSIAPLEKSNQPSFLITFSLMQIVTPLLPSLIICISLELFPIVVSIRLQLAKKKGNAYQSTSSIDYLSLSTTMNRPN